MEEASCSSVGLLGTPGIKYGAFLISRKPQRRSGPLLEMKSACRVRFGSSLVRLHFHACRRQHSFGRVDVERRGWVIRGLMKGKTGGQKGEREESKGNPGRQGLTSCARRGEVILMRVQGEALEAADPGFRVDLMSTFRPSSQPIRTLLDVPIANITKLDGTELDRSVPRSREGGNKVGQAGGWARDRTERRKGVGVRVRRTVGRGDVPHGARLRRRHERMAVSMERRGTAVERILLLAVWALAAKGGTGRSDGTHRGEPERQTGERGRIDGRHPDAGLVDLEELGDERVEVDVRVGKVVEGQLLPVPADDQGGRGVSLTGGSPRTGFGAAFDLHLELGVQDLHLQPMLGDLLLADALGLGLVALLVPERLDLMVLRQTFDQLGPQLARRIDVLHAVVTARGAHAAHGASGGPAAVRWPAGIQAGTVAHLSAVAREHHEPLVVLLGVMLLQLFRPIPGDVGVDDGAQIGASIRLDDHHVPRFDLQAGALLHVEDLGPEALEGDDAEQLIRRTGLGRRHRNGRAQDAALQPAQGRLRSVRAMMTGQGVGRCGGMRQTGTTARDGTRPGEIRRCEGRIRLAITLPPHRSRLGAHRARCARDVPCHPQIDRISPLGPPAGPGPDRHRPCRRQRTRWNDFARARRQTNVGGSAGLGPPRRSPASSATGLSSGSRSDGSPAGPWRRRSGRPGPGQTR